LNLEEVNKILKLLRVGFLGKKVGG